MKKKIFIFSNFFCAWDGGLDLLKHWLVCINASKKIKNIKINVVVPRNNLLSITKFLFFPLIFFFKNLKNFKFYFKAWPYWNGAKELEYFIIDNLSENINIVYSDYQDRKKIISDNRNSTFFPSIDDVLSKKNSVGYVFDLQHEYFPNNFGKKRNHAGVGF